MLFGKKSAEQPKEKYAPIPQETLHWIWDSLPIGTPTGLLKGEGSLSDLYIDDSFAIYADQDRSNEKRLVYQAHSEEDARLWLFQAAAERIGQELELRYRAEEQKKWRYVWDDEKTTPGHVVLKEQPGYLYNAEFDSRKWWMEYALKCLKHACDDAHYRDAVEHYLALMNRWFEQTHWTFDYEKQKFTEVKTTEA